MSEESFYLNGIDGVTGSYLVPPMSPADAVAAARGGPADPGIAGWLRRIRDALKRPLLTLPDGIDPANVARAGWGVVFARNTGADIRDALAPLVTRRRRQVPPDRCKVLEYHPGEVMNDWLKRYGVYVGSVLPTKVPYYLLLVGDPTAIPFEFQYLLGVEYAVGRLAFDRPEQYRRYAESVVDYELAGAVPNARQVVYWGTRHFGDPATRISHDYLITPLYEGLPAAGGQEAEPAVAAERGYRALCLKGRDATRANLAEVLHAAGQAPRPAVLFTASHGLGWPTGHANQRPAQGALLCQDWPGFGSMRPGHYLAAADIGDDARLHGLVAFLFACYGAGTPAIDNFLPHSAGGSSVAEADFIASLPQRLLTHPQGGALAVIGHVDRACGYSVEPPDVGPQLVPFRSLIDRILRGVPVGHSTKNFGQKFATLSAVLADRMGPGQSDPRASDWDVARTWLERNDARNYIIVGDPAVRLRTEVLH